MNPDQAVLTSIATGVLWWQVALAALAGAAIGFASGMAVIWLERHEDLEREETEERAEYERDAEQQRSDARNAGAPPPHIEPWLPERYGRTWLERWLAPLAGAAVFAVFTAHQGVGRELLIHLLWAAVFLHILVFDLKHHLVLDVVTLPALVVALALAPVTPALGFTFAAQGAIFCALMFLLLYGFGSVVFKGGLGFGDVKLAVVIGAVTGFNLDIAEAHMGAFYAIMYGVFLGGAAVIVMLITRIRKLRDAVAYAPFLCAGAMLVLYQNY